MLKNIRIVYMGTPEFAVAPLVGLLDAGFDVVAVVAVPDKPAGRGLKLQQCAVKQYAVSRGIPVYQPERLKDPDWIDQFRALNADLAIVVAFRMLPEVIWSMPRLGTFNLHASLLPAYRGAAPINWAIMNGDKKTGVTTFFLNHEIDCGEIIDSREVEISSTDNVGTLHDKLMIVGANLVVDTVRKITSGDFHASVQPVDHHIVSAAPKIFKDDCKLDFHAGIHTIYNKIRGLSPYPAAWGDFLGSTAKIFEAHVEPVAQMTVAPGTVENLRNKEIRIASIDGWVYIDRLQVAGKRAMSAADFLRGNQV